jgi:hypothetical protein
VTEVEPRRGVVVDERPGKDVLARLLGLATSVRRGTLRLVLLAAAAAAVIAYLLFRDGIPDETGRAVLAFVALALVVTPPVVLGAFWVVLGELLRLPERVRRMPLETREHAEEVRRLAADARARRGARSVPGQIWRLARLWVSSRELLTPYAPLLPLFSLPFLAAVVASAAAAVAEAVAALVVLLVLAFG